MLDIQLDNAKYLASIIIDQALIEQNRDPSKPIFDQVSKWLHDLFEKKRIESFELYEERFHSVWQRCQRSSTIAPFTLCVGAGIPALPGVSFELEHDQGNILGYLSIKTPLSSFSQWPSHWITLKINHATKAAFNLEANPAQIDAARMEVLLTRSPLVRRPIFPRPKSTPTERGKPYSLKVYRQENQIHAAIGDLNWFGNPQNYQAFLQDLHSTAANFVNNHDGKRVHKILIQHIHQCITRAAESHCRLDLDLPVICLASLGVTPTLAAQADKYEWEYIACVLLHLLAKYGILSTGQIHRFTEQLFSQDYLDHVIERLRAAKIIIKDSGGDIYSVESENFAFPRQVMGTAAAWRFRTKTIKLVEHCLNHVSAKKRSIQCFALGLSYRHMPVIRQRLTKLVNELLAKANKLEESKDLVLYQMSLQFFPLTIDANLPGSKIFDRPEENECHASQWLNIMIREMVTLDGFKLDEDWIRSKLPVKIARSTINKSISILKSTRMIELDPLTGKYKCTSQNIMTPKETKGEPVVQFHKSILELTGNYLYKWKEDAYLAWDAIFWCDQESYNRINQRFFEEAQDILSEQPTDPLTAIYQTNFQLLPLLNND